MTFGNAAAKREYRGNTETEGAVNDANVAKKVYYKVTVTTGPSVTPGDYGTTTAFRLPFAAGVNRRFYRVVISQP